MAHRAWSGRPRVGFFACPETYAKSPAPTSPVAPAGRPNERLAAYIVWAAAMIETCGPVESILEHRFTEAHATANITDGRSA